MILNIKYTQKTIKFVKFVYLYCIKWTNYFVLNDVPNKNKGRYFKMRHLIKNIFKSNVLRF